MNINATTPPPEKPTLKSLNLALSGAVNLLDCAINGYPVTDKDGSPWTTEEVLNGAFDILTDCQLQLDEISQKITALCGKNPQIFDKKGD